MEAAELPIQKERCTCADYAQLPEGAPYELLGSLHINLADLFHP